jgi:hypothetical protein
MSFRLSAGWATSGLCPHPELSLRSRSVRSGDLACASVNYGRALATPGLRLCLAGRMSRPPRQLRKLCRRAGLSLRSSRARLVDLACGSVNYRGLRPAQVLNGYVSYVAPASSFGRRMNDAVRWASWPRCQEVSGGKFEWRGSPCRCGRCATHDGAAPASRIRVRCPGARPARLSAHEKGRPVCTGRPAQGRQGRPSRSARDIARGRTRTPGYLGGSGKRQSRFCLPSNDWQTCD